MRGTEVGNDGCLKLLADSVGKISRDSTSLIHGDTPPGVDVDLGGEHFGSSANRNDALT